MNQPKPFKELNVNQVREYAQTYETQHPGAHPTFYPSEEVREGFNDLMGAYERQIHDLGTQVEGLQHELANCNTSLASRDKLITEQREQMKRMVEDDQKTLDEECRRASKLADKLNDLHIALDRVTAERDGNQTCINALREKLAALEKARRPVPHYKIWRLPRTAGFSKKGGPRKAKPICMAIVAREVDADILVDLYNTNYADVFYYTPEAMNGTT